MNNNVDGAHNSAPHEHGQVFDIDSQSQSPSNKNNTTKNKIIAGVAAAVIGFGAIGGGVSWWMFHNDGQENVVAKRDVNKGMGQQNLPEARTIDGVGKGKFTAVDPLNNQTINADIVGIDTTGDPNNAVLAPPEDISSVGWYVRSAPFGVDKGSTVLTSHIDYNGVTGVGTLFSSLRKGDPVTLTDGNGGQHHYVVSQEQVKINKEDPEYIRKTMNTINKKSGDNILVMITCGGEYNAASPLGYNQNWITVATPVDDEKNVKDIRK